MRNVAHESIFISLRMLYISSTLKILSTFVGTIAGESVGAMAVNSSAKLLTSSSSFIRGTKGARTAFLAISSQFKL